MTPITAKRGLDFEADDSIEITIAANAGACFGVVRAIKLGFQAAQRGQGASTGVYALGPLIHNPRVVEELTAKGVKTVESTSEITPQSTVVLRSHGVHKELETELRRHGVSIVDATCPLVKKPQRIAMSLGEKGYFLLVVGNATHPEVQGVLSYFGRPDYLVTYRPEDVDQIPLSVRRVGVIAQTTIEASVFEAVTERLRARMEEVAAYNTICDATSIRQAEVSTLAEKADLLVVIGGKNSSNTTKLVKIARDFGKPVYHIEDVSELKSEWFRGHRKIAVTGGASTPHEVIDETGNRIAVLLSKSLSEN